MVSNVRTRFPVSQQDQLKALIKDAGFTRSQLARQIEVSYRTVYRWLEKGVLPHPAASKRIDELFKEHIDLVPMVEKLKKNLGDPISILNRNKAPRDQFFLEMTYHSNAIEGSRMSKKETERAIGGKHVRGKEPLKFSKRSITGMHLCRL